MQGKWLPIALVIMMLVLLVSVVPTSAAPNEDGIVHIVQRGETLYGIARRYGVSMWTIARANGITNPNRIYVGQRLVIPTGQPVGTIHIVQQGENLFRIALHYGVSMWAIARANGIANINYIYVGQHLIIPGAAPLPGSSPTPTPLPPVSGGAFELGGQTHTLTHPNEMHYAGMSWVKFQERWSPGMTGNDVAGRIQQAHANGFKVLLSIPGGAEYPSSINFAAYVEFLRQVAEQGPDAIEVWNEQNIDREWPAGQIDPATYVQQMLAPAYNAIKSVNPNILVVSGAPAPTGFFGGGCTAAGCDDAPYVAGMVSAGAASYLDCVGVHYNEGILPPSQTGGDPRGNSSHYTRYFWGMVNTYYDRFGGQRQLCFTELGYVSPEGYGTLPANFAWAADTSVAEQAAWLAEAASLSASGGKVRLMIVYNVDFTLWSAHDPQAGYAIIRPDGSCPACETLHAVMGSR
nr:LysM peptidoglycan-binding domain-containing protein [Anaerolineae bacterium]